MKPIVVLHMVKEMELGGIQSLIMNVYRHIDRNKVQFHFLVNFHGFYDEEIIKLGGKIYYIPNVNKVGPILYVKNLKTFFKKHPEYQILHTHFSHFSGLIAKVASKSNVSTIITHSHNTSTDAKGLKLIYKKHIKKYIKKYATDYFACGQDAAKYMYGTTPAIIIKNGIDIEKYKFNQKDRKKYREELKIKDDTIVIGTVGRICEQKNPFFILNIFKEYVNLNNNSVLLLIGNGPLYDKLQENINESNLEEKVIILRNVDAIKYYNVMDYFLLPSLFEGFPFVLIEAQVNGLPIFSSTAVPFESNVSGKIEYIDLKKGEKYWSKKINDVAPIRYDECEKIEEAGYNIKTTAKKLEKFYLEKSKK